MIIEIECSRCHKKVEGWKDNIATAGFYIVQKGNYWSKYANEGEEYLCDECMFKEPRYIADYGDRIIK